MGSWSGSINLETGELDWKETLWISFEDFTPSCSEDQMHTLIEDAVILKRLAHLGTGKVALFKWRKGLSMPTEAERVELKRILFERHEDRIRARNEGEYAITYDPENPPYDHFAFKPYEEDFLADVELHGLKDAYWMWAVGQPCACLGRNDGAPFCNCLMRCLTAAKHATAEITAKT